eukprot:gb/GFBE01014893.1/.p1 GENE.gb/GFBE01014893.1/~~gb/GFBE01014893.1/.p1  ORF type:complete len:755 (+),score=190.10 gb/GFBE01014893.1/:1-2265(+)
MQIKQKHRTRHRQLQCVHGFVNQLVNVKPLLGLASPNLPGTPCFVRCMLAASATTYHLACGCPLCASMSLAAAASAAGTTKRTTKKKKGLLKKAAPAKDATALPHSTVKTVEAKRPKSSSTPKRKKIASKKAPVGDSPVDRAPEKPTEPPAGEAPAEDDLFSKSAWKASIADADKKLQDQKAAEENEKKALRQKRQQERREAEEKLAAKRQAEEAAAAAASARDQAAAASKAAAAKATGAKEESLSGATKRKAAAGSGLVAKKAKKQLQPDTNAYRKAHAIIVDDTSCPAPFENFEEVGKTMGSVFSKALQAQGYTAPTPIQAQAWPIALTGRDLVAVAETGSGKTCGFLLPALMRVSARGTTCPVPKKIDKYFSEPSLPSTLVLAPTRELAQQIAAEAEKFAAAAKARVVCIYGGVPKGDHVRELKQGADVLVATPGRLVDFATPNPSQQFKVCVALSEVKYFVLDEADRMLDMGFEPDLQKIVKMCPAPASSSIGEGKKASSATGRQTLFFTATWPKSVQHAAASFTRPDAVQIRIGQSGGDKLTANKNVTQKVIVLDYNKKLGRLVKVLKSELGAGETAIVFAATKGSCDYLERNICKDVEDVWCGAIHGDKEQWEREKTLNKFRSLTAGKEGQRGVLVATDVAARGLDIPGVPMVVVYDYNNGRGAEGADTYVHRIGRTGRAGLKGRAFTFFSPGENGAPQLVQLLEGAGQVVPPELAELAESRGGKWQSKGGGKGGSSGKGGWRRDSWW